MNLRANYLKHLKHFNDVLIYTPVIKLNGANSMQNTASSSESYITDNIIVGMGEVVSIRDGETVSWVLPGGSTTHDRVEATRYAEKLDRMVSANIVQFKRKLFSK